MRKTLVVLIVLLFCVGLSVYAQEAKAPDQGTEAKATEAKATETKAAETEATATKPDLAVIKGQVLSIDKTKNEFVLKLKNGANKTFQAGAALIEKLKQNEEIKVFCKAGTTLVERFKPVKKPAATAETTKE